jgi:hypothetical protein
MQSKEEVTEMIDSGTFEWSQRPCSPELRSTPVEKQVFLLTEAENFRVPLRLLIISFAVFHMCN